MEYINDCNTYFMLILFTVLTVFWMIKLKNNGNDNKNNNDDTKHTSANGFIGLILISMLYILPVVLDLSFYIDYSNSKVETKRIMLEKVTCELIKPYSSYPGKGTATRSNNCFFIYDSEGNKYLVANELLESDFKNKLILKDYVTIHYKETSRYDVVVDIDGLVFSSQV